VKVFSQQSLQSERVVFCNDNRRPLCSRAELVQILTRCPRITRIYLNIQPNLGRLHKAMVCSENVTLSCRVDLYVFELLTDCNALKVWVCFRSGGVCVWWSGMVDKTQKVYLRKARIARCVASRRVYPLAKVVSWAPCEPPHTHTLHTHTHTHTHRVAARQRLFLNARNRFCSAATFWQCLPWLRRKQSIVLFDW
jgi:hypothetical protein